MNIKEIKEALINDDTWNNNSKDQIRDLVKVLIKDHTSIDLLIDIVREGV